MIPSTMFLSLWSCVVWLLFYNCLFVSSSPDYYHTKLINYLLNGNTPENSGGAHASPRSRPYEAKVNTHYPAQEGSQYEAEEVANKLRYDEDEKSKGYGSSESGEYEYPFEKYWDYCKCGEKEHHSNYGHNSHSGHESHREHPFIVLITVRRCKTNAIESSEEETYPSSDEYSFGTGFIASPHCVVTAASLVSPKYHGATCLNITVSFCQHCSSSQHHHAGALNYSVYATDPPDETYDNYCVYHDEHDPVTTVYNLAIIKFKKPIPFECAKPACWYDDYSEPHWDYPDLPSHKVEMCGFGATNQYDNRSSCQRCVTGHLGSQKHCSKAISYDSNDTMTPYYDTCVMCTENQPMCYGGSASVVLYKPHANKKYGCPSVVIGIASWTVPDCTIARPVVYTSFLLHKIAEFIKLHCNCLPLPAHTYSEDDE